MEKVVFVDVILERWCAWVLAGGCISAKDLSKIGQKEVGKHDHLGIHSTELVSHCYLKRVHKSFMGLSDGYKGALILEYQLGGIYTRSTEERAEILGVSCDAYRASLSRARESMYLQFIGAYQHG